MKIAIPTRNNQVDDHFGHCEFYTIFSITDEKKVEKVETLVAPQGCGCKSNIVSVLQNMGVNTMLAGNMGQGAVNKISAAGIQVYRGCSGEVNQLVEAFLNQEVVDSGETCNQHQHHNHDHDHDQYGHGHHHGH
jgi:predicted Fe-Mo cluster-binding NifX family protein